MTAEGSGREIGGDFRWRGIMVVRGCEQPSKAILF